MRVNIEWNEIYPVFFVEKESECDPRSNAFSLNIIDKKTFNRWRKAEKAFYKAQNEMRLASNWEGRK